MPYYDQVFSDELDRVFNDFDLLLGRKTYEIFAGYWPYYDEDAPDGGIAKRFKDVKKYAVSRSGEVPVVLGGGKKLFADGSAPHSFKLTRSRLSPNGLIVAHYEREGDVRIGDSAVDSPSDREVARRERMKREN